MNHNPPMHGLDGESLQTDVMRFMAIIAFCLIAILSLVRDVESQSTAAVDMPEEKVVEKKPQQELQIASVDLPEIKAVGTPEGPVELFVELPTPSEEKSSPRLSARQHGPSLESFVELSEPELEQAPEPVHAEEPPIVQLDANPKPEPVVRETTSLIEEPEAEGLILLFVSDNDFLRLIAKGDVQVYAFQEREFLALGQNYEFYEAQAPKQVYEVLPETIPSLIDAALEKREHPSAATFKWGISLPERVERQIQRYLNTVSAGQLLIDRYGEVRHVASR